MNQQVDRNQHWPWRTSPKSRKVKVAEIIRDERLQPRSATDPALVRRYTTAMETGSSFPPLRLAEINGKLHLLCGWHRFEAATVKLGFDKVEAEVSKLPFKAAAWEAARDNLENGQAYRTTDMRRVFRAYIRAKQYKKPDGTLKSYREISRETQVKKSSLHNWMRDDFPDVARLMGGEQEGNECAGPPDLHPEAELLRIIERTTKELEAYFNCLSDLEKRFEVAEEVEAALKRMKELPSEKPEW